MNRPESLSGSPSSDPEKDTTKDFGGIHTLDAGLEDPDAHLSDAEKKEADRKLMRKLDLYLIPWLSLLYLVSFLDRTNIGNAHITGLQNIVTNGQYYAALSLFFASYALFEPLTNILLKRFRPRWFLTATMVVWGIVMVTMGLVHDFSGLAAARFFLGIAEAGLFPGVNYYLSCWYKREEFGKRAAIFFSAAALAGSFGGLLAAAIAQMDGIGGKAGWSWIFILEGLATVLIGIACIWMVHDFPDEAKFLTPDERARVLRRLHADKQASAESESFSIKYAKAGFADWKTWMFSFVYSGADMPLYAFSLFVPTIIKELGYTATRANLLSVPPYACAAVTTVAIGFLADRTKQRALCNMGPALVGIAGFAMLLASTNPHVKYGGVFLAALGIYPCISNVITWTGNNVEGVYKRGVVMGTVIGFGNLQGIISSNIYYASQGTQYPVGHGIIIAWLSVFLFCGSLVTRTLLAAENKKRLAGKRDYLIEGKTQEEIRMLGDNRPDFLYTL